VNAQGLPLTRETLDAMKQEQVNTQSIVSKQLARKLLLKVYRALTMEGRYTNVVLLNHPQFKNKIFTLKEFVGEMWDPDIEDLYG